MANADTTQAGKTTSTRPTGTKAPTRKSGAKTTGGKQAPKPRFEAKFLGEMRRKLLKERAKYLHSAEEYQAEAESLLATREPGDVQFDEEGGAGRHRGGGAGRDLACPARPATP